MPMLLQLYKKKEKVLRVLAIFRARWDFTLQVQRGFVKFTLGASAPKLASNQTLIKVKAPTQTFINLYRSIVSSSTSSASVRIPQGLLPYEMSGNRMNPCESSDFNLSCFFFRITISIRWRPKLWRCRESFSFYKRTKISNQTGT